MFKEMPKESIYEFARQSIPCVGFNTRRATRLITQYYDKILAPTGLRSTQYSLLSGLSMMGESSMQDLAFILAMDRTTLTRNLSPLQKRDWSKYPLEVTAVHAQLWSHPREWSRLKTPSPIGKRHSPVLWIN